ncbi:MAG: hypothetical protein AAF570_11895 [Bacteroidota bacterium]
MKLELNLSPDSYVDFAFGTVIKGKEAQVFQEYFPAVGALLKELEIKTLRGFAVLESNVEGHKPEQGALTYFKEVERHKAFVTDPRFLKVKPLRDDGMVFLVDGNMFEATDQSIALDSDQDYALVLSDGQPLQSTSLMQLHLDEQSPNRIFDGKTLSLYDWSDETEQLMGANSGSTVVFRVRFFPEQN